MADNEKVTKTVETEAKQAQEKAPKSKGNPNIHHKSISGTGVDLYLRSAFPVVVPDRKDPTKKNVLVSIIPVKRRDLAGEKNFGGAYVVNNHQKTGEGKDATVKTFHSQLVLPSAFNNIVKAAGAEPFDEKLFTPEVAEGMMKERKPLIKSADNIAFRANVYSDKKNFGSHAINQSSIQAPSKPFSYADEQKLDASARKANAEAKKRAKETAAKVRAEKAKSAEADEGIEA